MSRIDLALLLDRFVRRIHLRLQAKAPQFDTERIGPGGGIILLTLAEMGPSPMADLARRVARDKSQMTRVIDSFARKGLVKRTASATDARVTLVSLTTKGDGVVATLQTVIAETIDEVLEPMEPQDQAQLTDLLRRALS